MKVELVCTTDDPTDDLKYHKQIAESGRFYTKGLPTFRADELFFINKGKFLNYIQKLEKCVDCKINNLNAFLKAVNDRIEFFNQQGRKLSDFGVGEALNIVDFEEQEISEIF